MGWIQTTHLFPDFRTRSKASWRHAVCMSTQVTLIYFDITVTHKKWNTAPLYAAVKVGRNAPERSSRAHQFCRKRFRDQTTNYLGRNARSTAHKTSFQRSTMFASVRLRTIEVKFMITRGWSLDRVQTHAGHSIAFNMFLHFVTQWPTFVTHLWPFDLILNS